MTERFWLLEWMDSYGIRSPHDIDKVIAEPRKFDKLNAMAVAASTLPGEGPRTNNPIVAGRGIDLSGELTGANAQELISEVDRVFGTAWHYFDEVVVEGLSPRRYAKMCQDGNYNLARERARAHCQLLLHLRTVGALESVIFRQKPDPCTRHGTDTSVLDAAGLERILDEKTSIVQMLSEGDLVDIEHHADHFHYVYEHPLVGRQFGSLEGSCADRDEHDLKNWISSEIFELYAEYAAADASAAAELCAPLAISSPLHESIIDRTTSRIEGTQGIGADEVAIQIGLPILHGVSALELLKIREDETDAFERFRAALREAINETLKQADQVDASTIATNIIEEFVIPALHDVDQRLNVARKVLARKSIASLSVGVATVVAGLIARVPLLLPAGIALGMATPGANYAKYLEEKGQVELSDMYFLWKLQAARQ